MQARQRGARWALAATAVGVALSGCTGQLSASEDEAGSTAAAGTRTDEQALDPWGPLSVDRLSRQRVLERRAIDLGNGLGRRAFATAVNVELARAGLDLRYEPVASVLGDEVSTPVPALPAAACPYLAATGSGTSTSIACRYLAERARDDAFVRVVGAIRDNPLTGDFVTAMDPVAVQTWYETSSRYGVEGELSRAVEALRAQGACDTEPTPVESSFDAGVQIGRARMVAIVAEIQARTPDTQCNFDAAIVQPARTQALEEAPAMLTSHPLCAGFDVASIDDRTRYAEAERQYALGVETGIREAATTESERLFRTWVCRVPTGGGGGGSGDPLVLDLDGNGIRVEQLAYGPTFHFGDRAGLVRTEWTVPGDAFVVLDRDGDGQIAATELFGDVTVTEDGMMARDGLEALALYDARARGGNADGVIDSHDRVWGALGAWSDRDGNARVSGGELVGLDRAGVSAIALDGSGFVAADGRRGLAADLTFDFVSAGGR